MLNNQYDVPVLDDFDSMMLQDQIDSLETQIVKANILGQALQNVTTKQSDYLLKNCFVKFVLILTVL